MDEDLTLIRCMCAIDGPRNMSLFRASSHYFVGEVIHCSAEGDPEPTYQWIDLASGKVTKGRELRIRGNMVDKNNTFMCVATNEHNNSTFNSSFTAEGTRMYIRTEIAIKQPRAKK